MAGFGPDTFTAANDSTPSGYTVSTYGSGSGGGVTVQSNEARLRTPNGGSFACGARAIRDGASVANGELLFKLGNHATLLQQYIGVYVRASGGWASGSNAQAGYFFNFGVNDTVCYVSRYASGTEADDFGSFGCTWSAGQRKWVRIRFEGSALKAKVWNVGDSEPGSWTWEKTDSNLLTAGGVYFVNNCGPAASNQDAFLDDVELVDFDAPPPPDPPVAAFTGTPLSGVAPLEVTFTDQSTDDPTAWAWDFGDSTTSTAQHPVHEYEEPGTYTVTLEVSNDGGSDDETKTNYVTVSEPPPPPPSRITTTVHIGIA